MSRPASLTIGGLVRELAARTPASDAVIHADDRLDFARLESESALVAKALLGLGVRRGDRVAALIGNRPEWVVLLFAVTRIGATYVPLNTWYKAAELSYAIGHCTPVALAAGERIRDVDLAARVAEIIPEFATSEPGRLRSAAFPELRTVAVVDAAPPGAMSWSELRATGRAVPDATLRAAEALVTPEDILIVLYTSGSTAHPKAVTLAQGNVIANGYDIGERRTFTGDDRVWLGTPLFYALGAVNGLPAALTRGAAVVLQDHFDAGVALDLIERERCTGYYGVGVMTRRLLDHPAFTRSRVRTLEKGTAGLYPEEKRLSIVELGVSRATTSYGLTESCGNCTGGLPDEDLRLKLETEGLPLPGFDLKLIDPSDGTPVRDGGVGLLKIRGHVTPGYLGDPAANAAAFDAEGFFDTGDLGRFASSGHWIFHARLKEIIKTGGINVSPLEIESLLVSHPLVTEACVVGVASATHGELVVAFVRASEDVSERDLQDHVRAQVAGFKVPVRIFVSAGDDLPRLASGKVARVALREEASLRIARAQ